jgi:hypothetical protein
MNKTNLFNTLKDKANILNTLTNGIFAEQGFKAVQKVEKDLGILSLGDLEEIIQFLQKRIEEELNKKKLFEQLKINMMKINDLSDISNTDEKFIGIMNNMFSLLPKISIRILTTSIDMTKDVIECFEKQNLAGDSNTNIIEEKIKSLKKIFNIDKNNHETNDDLKWN